MDLSYFLDRFPEPWILAGGGMLVGIVFGAFAQQSRFCLRAAVIEFAHGKVGSKLAVWLLAFSSAVLGTQALIFFANTPLSEARQLASPQSLSGAALGGLMFGSGMILARGCASRLLVLSGTGKMRALVAGLVVTLVAQASYRGVLAPAREAIASLWTISGGADRDLSAILGIGRDVSIILAFLGLTAGIWLAARARIGLATGVSALLVGLAVTLGWLGTWAVASISFEVVPISSVTFTGPSTDTLMALVAEREIALSFGIGLVPGVFLGSAAMAALRGEWKLERFGADTPIERYLIGAVLMGFGAMLAGGCAVGAGVSGGAVLSLTAWVAAASMWAGALAMQIVLKPRPAAFVTS